MVEQVDLTSPIMVDPGATVLKVANVYLQILPAPLIKIRLSDDAGRTVEHSYEGGVALTLLQQLNVADNSTTSLHKRIMQRLISDGVITGTISGTPDT